MSKILIIGTEQVGKTTLLTALAHKYSIRRPNDYFIDAQTLGTTVFKNSWSTLEEKREWLPSTVPGSSIHLTWKLHLRDEPNRTVDMTCSDVSGENYRSIFASDKDPQDLLNSADAIIVLVNLASLLDEIDELKKTENEWVIKNCLDKAYQYSDKPLCIVFTQCDKYKGYFVDDADGSKLVENLLPDVYGVYHKSITKIHARSYSWSTKKAFYYGGSNSEGIGPYTEEQLKVLHTQGTINDSTYVWYLEADKWQPFRTLKIPSGINPLADSDSNPISATGENKLSGLASSSLGEECAKKIQIFQVSAVNKTRPFEDPDGYYIEKPAEGFHSEGLEELMDWIATALKCADDKRIDREAYEKKHRVKVFIRHFLSSFNKVTARISFTNHPILKYISGL